jgi:hypothetical protein
LLKPASAGFFIAFTYISPMTITNRVENHFQNLTFTKEEALRALYQLIREEIPQAELHFFDGLNEEGKVVTNPTIGFGKSRIYYTNGSFQDTFRIGICATSAGLSIHILGLKDKNFLNEFLGTRLGKAKITGYAIRFGKMSDIDEGVLRELVRIVVKS